MGSSGCSMNTHEETEEWRVIAEFPNYEVSNLGRVRSWAPLFATSKRPDKPMPMTIQHSMSGYHSLRLTAGGRSFGRQVHRLVAAAFCERASPDQTIVRHLDGSRTNNRATNLKWGTYAENSQDQYIHGNAKFGEQHTRSKLTDAQAREIFENGDSTCAELALKYGVTPSTISNIRTGFSRQRNGHEGSSPGAVGTGGRIKPRKISADVAREIFMSKDPIRVLAERHGVSENFVSQIWSSRKRSSATAGLVAPERERAFYGKVFTVSPLKTLTEEQVIEIFLSPLNGREVAVKVGATEGHVSMIRSRQVCGLITKDLVPPDRPSVQKLDREKAREIFLSTGPLKAVGDKYGVSLSMVGLIRRRLSWAHATADLPGYVAPVS